MFSPEHTSVYVHVHVHVYKKKEAAILGLPMAFCPTQKDPLFLSLTANAKSGVMIQSKRVLKCPLKELLS
jgi:hypothetical protein